MFDLIKLETESKIWMIYNFRSWIFEGVKNKLRLYLVTEQKESYHRSLS